MSACCRAPNPTVFVWFAHVCDGVCWLFVRMCVHLCAFDIPFMCLAIQEWHEQGGVLVTGYELFRLLSAGEKFKRHIQARYGCGAACATVTSGPTSTGMVRSVPVA